MIIASVRIDFENAAAINGVTEVEAARAEFATMVWTPAGKPHTLDDFYILRTTLNPRGSKMAVAIHRYDDARKTDDVLKDEDTEVAAFTIPLARLLGDDMTNYRTIISAIRGGGHSVTDVFRMDTRRVQVHEAMAKKLMDAFAAQGLVRDPEIITSGQPGCCIVAMIADYQAQAARAGGIAAQMRLDGPA